MAPQRLEETVRELMLSFSGYTRDPIVQLKMLLPIGAEIGEINVGGRKVIVVRVALRAWHGSVLPRLSLCLLPLLLRHTAGHTDHTASSSRWQVGVISIAQILSANRGMKRSSPLPVGPTPASPPPALRGPS
jgi:hypothetical protein